MSRIGRYNPLDTRNLGRSVAEAMLERTPQPLGALSRFDGAGIYAIYYIGSFPAYFPIAQQNKDGKFALPIYVGKAVAPGARKGNVGVGPTEGPYLFGRLVEHADSIRAAKNLQIRDFFCRYLVVDDIWIPLGESLLIAKFVPVWNRQIDGFGNHDPGSGRYRGMRPRWDVLHPGRAWAERCAPRTENSQQIAVEVKAYLRSLPSITPHLFTEEDLNGGNAGN
jgi:hypothetical protein